MSFMPVRRALKYCALACAIVASGFLSAGDLPQPVELKSKDVAGYLVIPDVSGTLDKIDAIAKKAAPGQYQAGLVKLILGMSVGDPTLANVGTKPLVLMVFNLDPEYDGKNPPPMALFIPANAASPYDEAIKQADPKAQTAFADGVLTVATDADGLVKAQAHKADYEALVSAKLDTGIRAYVNVASLVGTFGEKLKGAIKLAEGQALEKLKNPPPDLKVDPAQLTKMTKLGFKSAESLLDEVDAIQLDLKMTPDAVGLHWLGVAKPGTIMAELFTSGTPAPSKKFEGLVEKGVMNFYGHYDPKAHVETLKKIQAAIAADPETADLAKSDLFDFFSEAQEASGGEIVGSFKVSDEGALVTSIVATVADKAKYDKVLEASMKLFAPGSFFGDLYKGMGMSMDMKLESNVRQHAGVDVNRITTTLDMKNAPPDTMKMMKKWMKPSEMASVKDFEVQSNDPAELDRLVDAVSKGDISPNGLELKSRAAFGEGRQFYFDYDFVGLLKAMMAGDPNNPAAAIFGKLTPGSPLLFSVGMAKGSLLLEQQIPVAPIAEMVKVFGDMNRAVQNGVPKKPEKDEGKF